MSRLLLSTILTIVSSNLLFSQEQINGSIPFQTDPGKDYSIFIPSAYQEEEPIPAFLALHPLNTNRWNAQTWCEELSDFAEANGVILVCPDGGEDGKIDDPIDTAFTSFLLDSAFIWYSIDETKLYATGFSWGGKTTYTYGLNHIEKFAGLMPIGAAISVGEVNGISENIDNVPIYIIHGSQDNPNVRYFPLLEEMEANGGCVESILMQGVGHTIDFDNQVEILTEGYEYLQENECTATSVEDIDHETKVEILPYTMIAENDIISLNLPNDKSWQIFGFDGTMVKTGFRGQIVMDLTTGLYIIQVGKHSQKFMVY